MEFKRQTLPNGLEVIAEVQPEAFSMSIGFFVNTGARDETPELSGVSHFLEHMLFKGTPTRSAEQLNQMLDDLGSQSNAYTSEEQTVYYLSSLPEFQGQALELLADMMRPALREEDFETERQVILEEIAMYDDQPPYGAIDRLMEDYFQGHPLAGRVLGSCESVSQLKTDAMRRYHEAHYAPNHLCLVAAGAVDFDRLVDQAHAATESWQPRPRHRLTQKHQPKNSRRLLIHPPAIQQYTVAFAPGPSRSDPEKHATRLMTSILGDDTGSRLFWRLVDTGDAEAASLFTQEYQDCGVVGIFLSCQPPAGSTNWRAIGDELKKGLRDKLTEGELQQAKNKVCSSIALAAERPSNRLFSVGNAWTLRQTYETVAESVAKYQQVTVDQCQAALEKLLSAPTVIVSVGPEENRDLSEAIQSLSLGG
jgi:predicted Zn-dependent peptidase